MFFSPPRRFLLAPSLYIPLNAFPAYRIFPPLIPPPLLSLKFQCIAFFLLSSPSEPFLEIFFQTPFLFLERSPPPLPAGTCAEAYDPLVFSPTSLLALWCAQWFNIFSLTPGFPPDLLSSLLCGFSSLGFPRYLAIENLSFKLPLFPPLLLQNTRQDFGRRLG